MEVGWARLKEEQMVERQGKVMERKREEGVVKKEMVRRWKQQRVNIFWVGWGGGGGVLGFCLGVWGIRGLSQDPVEVTNENYLLGNHDRDWARQGL